MADNPIERGIEYISRWLKTNDENQRAVRPLTDILEALQWAKATVEGFRQRGGDVARLGTVFGGFEKMYDSLVQFVPLAPSVNIVGLERVTSTATTVFSTGLIGIIPSGSADTGAHWVTERMDAWNQIQDKHQTIEKLRRLVLLLQSRDKHSPDLILEYEIMIDKAFYYNGTGIDKSVSAGISMRNVLEHFKGKLFLLAIRAPGEKMDWKLMIARLVPAANELESSLLLSEEVTWHELHQELTDMAKNRREIDIRILAVRVIGHIYAVLRLLDLEQP